MNPTWLVPILSVVTLLLWVRVTWLSAPLIEMDAAPPRRFRIVTLSGVVLASLGLVLSSLARVDVITSELGRFALDVVRVGLFAGGSLAWIELRRFRA